MDSFHNFDLNFLPDENPWFDLNGVPTLEFATGEDEVNEDDDEPDLATDEDEINENDDEPGKMEQRKCKALSIEVKRLIYNALLQRSVNGNLKRNTTSEVSSLFSVNRRTIRRIWNHAKSVPNDSDIDFSDKRGINSGRKRVTIDLSQIANIPLPERTTLRSLAQKLNVKRCTLHKRFKEGNLRRHSSAIKPFLREENKVARLKFCISMLDATTIPHNPMFSGTYNTIHIDEKWFYLSKKSTTYYLHKDEEDPLRTCQSKNFIGKVMFLATIARPRFDEEGNEIFSGKIGVFPFVTKEPAIRRSRNREAGTMETKPITSVKKETIRAFLIEKVIPAIRAKWPAEELGKTIFIQQDNARTHVRPDDEGFNIAASRSGFDIRLLCQPANSPDMNVLDLGFFNAIQSLKDKEQVRTVDELIGAVQRAFEAYPAKEINNVFLSLQLCMRQTMVVGGSNNYKIPHVDKHGLERRGCLPKVFDCPLALVENVMSTLGVTSE